MMNEKWRAKQPHSFTLPASWQQLQQGELYCNAIQRACMPWLEKILGDQLVKIGGLSAEILCPTGFQQIMFSPEIFPNSMKLQGQQMLLIETALTELPLKDKTVDACLLINSFNFCQDPHQLLRESSRVLVDNGYLLITLFNPLSALLFKRNIQRKQNEKITFRHFLPCRITDWLELLSFEIVFQTPLFTEKTLSKKILGKKRPLFLAPLYFIVAQKQVYPLRLNPLKTDYQAAENLQPVGAFKAPNTADLFNTN